MIIKANLEVPPGLFCNMNNDCVYYKNIINTAGHCNLFFEYLLFRDQYSTVARKCKKCIEAGEKGRLISLAEFEDKIRNDSVLMDQILFTEEAEEAEEKPVEERAFCEKCRENMLYIVHPRRLVNAGVAYNGYEAVCLKCHTDVYVPEVMLENYIAWRSAASWAGL